jgi:hypothetical protein
LTSPDPLTPESILARAAIADLTLQLARWTLRRWNQLPTLQRSALNYGLNHGSRVGKGQVVFSVQLSSLLEALDVLRTSRSWKSSEPEDLSELCNRKEERAGATRAQPGEVTLNGPAK